MRFVFDAVQSCGTPALQTLCVNLKADFETAATLSLRTAVLRAKEDLPILQEVARDLYDFKKGLDIGHELKYDELKQWVENLLGSSTAHEHSQASMRDWNPQLVAKYARGELTCWHCQKTGHTKKDCPDRAAGKPKKPRPGGGGGGGGGGTRDRWTPTGSKKTKSGGGDRSLVMQTDRGKKQQSKFPEQFTAKAASKWCPAFVATGTCQKQGCQLKHHKGIKSLGLRALSKSACKAMTSQSKWKQSFGEGKCKAKDYLEYLASAQGAVKNKKSYSKFAKTSSPGSEDSGSSPPASWQEQMAEMKTLLTQMTESANVPTRTGLARVSTSSVARAARSVRCSRCGEPGHDESECPESGCPVCGEVHGPDECPEQARYEKMRKYFGKGGRGFSKRCVVKYVKSFPVDLSELGTLKPVEELCGDFKLSSTPLVSAAGADNGGPAARAAASRSAGGRGNLLRPGAVLLASQDFRRSGPLTQDWDCSLFPDDDSVVPTSAAFSEYTDGVQPEQLGAPTGSFTGVPTHPLPLVPRAWIAAAAKTGFRSTEEGVGADKPTVGPRRAGPGAKSVNEEADRRKARKRLGFIMEEPNTGGVPLREKELPVGVQDGHELPQNLECMASIAAGRPCSPFPNPLPPLSVTSKAVATAEKERRKTEKAVAKAREWSAYKASTRSSSWAGSRGLQVNKAGRLRWSNFTWMLDGGASVPIAHPCIKDMCGVKVLRRLVGQFTETASGEKVPIEHEVAVFGREFPGILMVVRTMASVPKDAFLIGLRAFTRTHEAGLGTFVFTQGAAESYLRTRDGSFSTLASVADETDTYPIKLTTLDKIMAQLHRHRTLQRALMFRRFVDKRRALNARALAVTLLDPPRHRQHQKMLHRANVRQAVAAGALQGVKVRDPRSGHSCQLCDAVKTTVKHDTGESVDVVSVLRNAPYAFHTVHLDFKGPVPAARDGERFGACFTDMKSGQRLPLPLTLKTQTPKIIMQMMDWVRMRWPLWTDEVTGGLDEPDMKVVLVDWDPYLLGAPFKAAMSRMGIRVQAAAPPYHPWRHGTAEVCVKQVWQDTLLSLWGSDAPIEFWALAMRYLGYYYYRLPIKLRGKWVTPQYVLEGRATKYPEDFVMLEPFFTPCVIARTKVERSLSIWGENQKHKPFRVHGEPGRIVGVSSEYPGCHLILAHGNLLPRPRDWVYVQQKQHQFTQVTDKAADALKKFAEELGDVDKEQNRVVAIPEVRVTVHHTPPHAVAVTSANLADTAAQQQARAEHIEAGRRRLELTTGRDGIQFPGEVEEKKAEPHELDGKEVILRRRGGGMHSFVNVAGVVEADGVTPGRVRVRVTDDDGESTFLRVRERELPAARQRFERQEAATAAAAASSGADDANANGVRANDAEGIEPHQAALDQVLAATADGQDAVDDTELVRRAAEIMEAAPSVAAPPLPAPVVGASVATGASAGASTAPTGGAASDASADLASSPLSSSSSPELSVPADPEGGSVAEKENDEMSEKEEKSRDDGVSSDGRVKTAKKVKWSSSTWSENGRASTDQVPIEDRDSTDRMIQWIKNGRDSTDQVLVEDLSVEDLRDQCRQLRQMLKEHQEYMPAVTLEEEAGASSSTGKTTWPKTPKSRTEHQDPGATAPTEKSSPRQMAKAALDLLREYTRTEAESESIADDDEEVAQVIELELVVGVEVDDDTGEWVDVNANYNVGPESCRVLMAKLREQARADEATMTAHEAYSHAVNTKKVENVMMAEPDESRHEASRLKTKLKEFKVMRAKKDFQQRFKAEGLAAEPKNRRECELADMLSGGETQWVKAREDEYKSFWDVAAVRVRKLSDLPKGTKILRGFTILKAKKKGGRVVRYKARLVIDGSREQVPWKDKFSPTARQDTIRIVSRIAAYHSLCVAAGDAKTAFLFNKLHGKYGLKVFRPSADFKKEDGSPLAPDEVLEVVSHLYGLSSAPAGLYASMKSIFEEDMGLVRNKHDHCCFFGAWPGGYCIVISWVDDSLIVTTDWKVVDNFETLIQAAGYTYTIEKWPSEYTGIEYEYFEDGSLRLTQQAYTLQIIKRFEDHWGERVPLRHREATEKFNDFALQAAAEKFLVGATKKEIKTRVAFGHRFCGSVLYLCSGTRPDLCSALQPMLRAMQRPSDLFVAAAKHMIGYLKQLADRRPGLFYPCKSKGEPAFPKLEAFVDAAYGVRSNGKSVTGYVIYLASAPVSWSCTSQRILALSSTEAEFIAVSDVVKMVLWAVMLLGFMGFRTTPVGVHVDNEAAIKLSSHSSFFSRTKHVLLRYLHVRDVVAAGIVDLYKVLGTDNVSDLTTKVVAYPRAKFEHLRARMLHLEKTSGVSSREGARDVGRRKK